MLLLFAVAFADEPVTWDDTSLSGEGADDDGYGQLVVGVGDVDQDGFDDVMVGAPLDSTTFDHAGAAYLYRGGPEGLDATAAQLLMSPEPSANAYFGELLAGGADLDGDGYPDLIGVSGGLGEGVAGHIFPGGPDGLGAPVYFEAPATPGAGIAVAGDINADGFDDVVMSTGDGGDAEGRALLYMGGVDGLDTLDAVEIASVSGQVGALFGLTVAGAGDINADGYDEVVVGALFGSEGAWEAGSAFIFNGGAAGVDPDSVQTLISPRPHQYDYFSWGMVGDTDVDGDGFDDLAVSARGAGAAYIFRGSADGVVDEGEQFAEGLGEYVSIGGSGDLGVDGGFSVTVNDGDRAGLYVFDGLALDGGGPIWLSQWAWTAEPEIDHSVAMAGDTNGDGLDDLIIGAAPYQGGVGESAAYVVYGDCVRAWYVDLDQDGFGDAESAVATCEGPEGMISRGGDCDDAVPTINPDANDPCGDGIDSDCDGIGGPDGDEDGDGLSWAEEDARGSSDCDPYELPDDDDPEDTPEPDCGCASTGSGGPPPLLLLGLLAIRRRRL